MQTFTSPITSTPTTSTSPTLSSTSLTSTLSTSPKGSPPKLIRDAFQQKEHERATKIKMLIFDLANDNDFMENGHTFNIDEVVKKYTYITKKELNEYKGRENIIEEAISKRMVNDFEELSRKIPFWDLVNKFIDSLSEIPIHPLELAECITDKNMNQEIRNEIEKRYSMMCLDVYRQFLPRLSPQVMSRFIKSLGVVDLTSNFVNQMKSNSSDNFFPLCDYVPTYGTKLKYQTFHSQRIKSLSQTTQDDSIKESSDIKEGSGFDITKLKKI